ncbi:MAG: acyl-ACP--UDP-N-acetylglucosamine O-acyltransferase [Candidatus Melainabacteria bacterium]|nr:acyl-ACP--UDP-N-acetylglucosamine O-acyltransferase [Candidatus Melainabacteria bacterium]
MSIHATAIIADGAKIADSAEIGPYAVIGKGVTIGERTIVGPHCVIDGDTTIGADCKIYASVAIGLDPQDLGYKGEFTGVKIGDRTTLREFVTIHRATKEGYTTLGNDCFLMNYSHIAHNCKVGNGVIMANNATLGGYVEVGDNVVFGGTVAVHQNVKIGRLVMMGGITGTRKDMPPFAMMDGRPAKVCGINLVGMKRNKFGPEIRKAVKDAYKMIYRDGMNQKVALERVEAELGHYAEVQEIVNFYRTSKRGVCIAMTSYDEIRDEAVSEEKPLAEAGVGDF